MRAVIAIIQGQGVMIKLILKVFAKWFHFFFVCSLFQNSCTFLYLIPVAKGSHELLTPGNGDLKLN